MMMTWKIVSPCVATLTQRSKFMCALLLTAVCCAFFLAYVIWCWKSFQRQKKEIREATHRCTQGSIFLRLCSHHDTLLESVDIETNSKIHVIVAQIHIYCRFSQTGLVFNCREGHLLFYGYHWFDYERLQILMTGIRLSYRSTYINKLNALTWNDTKIMMGWFF